MSFKLPRTSLTAELELYIRLTEKDAILEPRDHVHTNIARATNTTYNKINTALSTIQKTYQQIHTTQALTKNLFNTTRNNKLQKLRIFSALILEAKKKKILLSLVLTTLINFFKIWAEQKILNTISINTTILQQFPYLYTTLGTQQQQKTILQIMQKLYNKVFALRKQKLIEIKNVSRQLWLQHFKYRKKIKKNLYKVFDLKNLHTYKKTRKSFVFINLNFLNFLERLQKNLNL